jgi:hypothetical protein
MALNLLAALAILMGDGEICGNRDHNLLQLQGWIPLGERRDGKFCWTTLERGLKGAVPTEEALQIEREKRTK